MRRIPQLWGLFGWGGRAGSIPSWPGHQRCRTTSKATQSLGVDDYNPPLGPLLATSTPQPSNTRTHTEQVDCSRYVRPPASLLPPRAHQPLHSSINHSSLSSDIDFCFMARVEEGVRRAGAGDATNIWGGCWQWTHCHLTAQTLSVELNNGGKLLFDELCSAEMTSSLIIQ